MMTVDPLDIDDLPSISPLQPEKWSALEPVHEFYLGSTACFPHKAVVDGKTVGIGTAIAFDGTGWLAHVIVAPEERNKGYGGAIVSFLMDFLQEKCRCKTISLIASDMGFPLYLKYGFRAQEEYAVYEGAVGGRVGETDASIKIIEEDHRRVVLELDRAVSGEDRRGILAPHLDDGYLYLADGDVKGFYLPTLGEGLVIAKDGEAGRALMKRKLADGPGTVTLPASNAEGRKYLSENGFSEARRIRRMFRGESFSWKAEWVYSRIGGYLG